MTIEMDLATLKVATGTAHRRNPIQFDKTDVAALERVTAGVAKLRDKNRELNRRAQEAHSQARKDFSDELGWTGEGKRTADLPAYRVAKALGVEFYGRSFAEITDATVAALIGVRAVVHAVGLLPLKGDVCAETGDIHVPVDAFRALEAAYESVGSLGSEAPAEAALAGPSDYILLRCLRHAQTLRRRHRRAARRANAKWQSHTSDVSRVWAHNRRLPPLLSTGPVYGPRMQPPNGNDATYLLLQLMRTQEASRGSRQLARSFQGAWVRRTSEGKS